MIRKLTLAAVMTAVVALPVMAQETPKIDPSTKGPTDVMTKEVPAMKGTAPATGAQPSAAMPDKPMSTTAAPTTVSPTASDATIKAGSIVLSQEDEKTWIGKPVYGNDQKKFGDVVSFRRGPGGEVVGMNAGIGGFLGLGETHVVLTSSQFKLQGDRIVADLPSTDAAKLPKAQ
ncbi:MAG: PRC-barrel domain-containing protein [Hyphomicrobiaceae bacterium]